MRADRLRSLRTIMGKTQKDLAEYLGITRQGYGNYENGVTEPDNETQIKLAEYFDVTIDYLLGKSDQSSAKKEDNASGGRAYYGGGSDWTEEEKAAADAFIEMLRKRKQQEK